MFFNKLWEIEIANFCSIESMKLDTRKQRLTHIIGINNDDTLSPSNGSGKSTIKSAVCWNLFGMTETGRQADSILPWKQPKNCKVSTVWSNGTSYITITRYRAHKEEKNALKLFLNGEEITGKDNDDTQRTIESYLGFNYDLFCNLLTTGMTSKKSKDFMLMTDKEKKEFVGFLLDLSFLNTAQEKVKEVYKVAEAQSKEKNETLISVKSAIATTEQSVEFNRNKVRIHEEQTKQAIHNKQVAVDGQNEEIKQRRQKLENLRNEVKAIIVPPEPNTADLDGKKKQVKLYRDSNDEQQATKAKKSRELVVLTQSLGSEIVVDENIPIIAKARSDLASAERELYVTNSSDTSRLSDKQIDTMISNLSKYEGKLESAKHDLATAEAIEIGETCPTCKQSLPVASVEAVKLDKLSKVTNAKDSIASWTDKITSLTTELANLKATKVKEAEQVKQLKVSELTAEITQLKSIYEEAKKAEYDRIFKAKDIQNIKNKITAVEAEISTIDAIIATNTKNISKLEAIIETEEAAIRQQQAEVISAMKRRESLKAQFNALKGEYDALKARVAAEEKAIADLTQSLKVNPYTQFVESSLAVLQDKQKQLLEVEAEIAKLEDEKRYLDFWLDGFGDKGIKSYILDSVTMLLEEKANYALSQITNGNVSLGFHTQKKNKNDTLKEEFTVEIYRDGDQVQFVDLSKGERCRVSFAVNYALKALGMYYHGLNLNFEWYDEVLDGLDEIGCYQVVQFLRKELNTYESIYVVSHNDNVKGMFDKNLIVEKTNGKSVLRNEN